MRNDFDTVLDECLGRLKTGDSVEACLVRYPEHAEELEPLLETLQFIEPLRFVEPPRPEALARGRERFLAEAAQMGQQQNSERSQPDDPSLSEKIRRFFAPGLLGPAWGRAVAVVVVVLLLFGALGRVAVQASADSLPGDPLYPVKQVSRQVQLLTTLNSETREMKAQAIQAQEREEVQQATAQGRTFEEDVSGLIVRWLPDSLIELEGNLSARVTGATEIEGQPLVGRAATVRLRSEDGRLVAEQITVHSEARAMLVPTGTPTVTRTATQVPTETPRPTNTPEPTQKPPPTAVPTSTPTPKPKLTDTPTLQPTADVGPSIDIYEWTGAIQSINGDVWVVAGQEIQIVSSTIIKGEPAEGRIAHVRANRLADDTFVADEIEVEEPGTPTRPPKVFLSGVASQESSTIWYVSGQRVRLDDRTQIVGELKEGAFVSVEGLRESTTTVFAEKITVERTCENTVLLEGTLLDFNEEIWVVEVVGESDDGQLVRTRYTIGIDQDTQIQNEPRVRAIVQLETCKVGDTYIAHRIYVVPPTPTPASTATAEPESPPSTPTVSTNASPSSTPSPTEPAPTPTPTSTEPPTATATVSPGPSPTGTATSTEPAATPTPTQLLTATPTSTQPPTATPTPADQTSGTAVPTVESPTPTATIILPSNDLTPTATH